MNIRTKLPRITLVVITGTFVLAGCVSTTAVDDDGAFRELPEPLLDLAAPYQNLNKVRLEPNDNCFWYLYDGPVEQTWLPLRTDKGNPICQATS